MKDDAAGEDNVYRRLIDLLVEECRTGQGQIGVRRSRTGIWNASATSEKMPDQHDMNVLLQRLSPQDRETLARMLEQQFVSGVHAALVILHGESIRPFDRAYEGTPFHDFVRRLADWEWPQFARS
jgi:hypothetical protein